MILKKIIPYLIISLTIFSFTSAFANDNNEINVSKLRNDLIITKAKLLKKAKELENTAVTTAEEIYFPYHFQSIVVEKIILPCNISSKLSHPVSVQ